jgi:drug/metabolite transporter (DMT)-like permease
MSRHQADERSFTYKAVNWALLIFCAIVWGFSYFLIKHALHGFAPVQLAVIRIISSGIVLLPFLFMAFRKIPWNKYLFVFVCAIAGNGLPLYLYPLAQTHISSSITGIINSLTPLFTYIIGVIFFGLTGSRMKTTGIIIGLLGAVSLVLFKSQAELKAEGLFIVVALLAPVSYGINGNVLKKHLTGLPSLPLTSLMYFMMLIPSLPVLFYTGVPEQLKTNEAARDALPFALCLGVIGTAVAMSLFNILIKRTHIMFAASVSYLMPVVAILLGIFDNEQIGWHEFLGLTLILAGVILINRMPAEKRNV